MILTNSRSNCVNGANFNPSSYSFHSLSFTHPIIAHLSPDPVDAFLGFVLLAFNRRSSVTDSNGNHLCLNHVHNDLKQLNIPLTIAVTRVALVKPRRTYGVCGRHLELKSTRKILLNKTMSFFKIREAGRDPSEFESPHLFLLHATV